MFFKKSEQKIKFLHQSEIDGDYELPPSPSIKNLPKWFKMQDKRILPSEADSYSVKACVPILDSLSAGYKMCARSDFTLAGYKENNTLKWRAKWASDFDVIAEHGVEQVKHHPMIKNENGKTVGLPLKYNSEWYIETEPGYSCMFLPILNDVELQRKGIHFLSGTVDTDSYNRMIINFPFIFNNFTEKEIVIKKGTPLVQIFPFKREKWTSEVSKVDKNETLKAENAFHRVFNSFYRNNHWSKKSYK